MAMAACEHVVPGSAFLVTIGSSCGHEDSSESWNGAEMLPLTSGGAARALHVVRAVATERPAERRGAMDELGTVLGVWGHPDDETYLSAGLMAHAARSGSRVVDVTATRGEGGSMDEERWPSETMGEVREREMQRSLAVLGVREHHFLGLPDIDMDTALPEEGAAKVRAMMLEVDPDTVLTFGPEGMTGHEGHKSVSRWTTQAFRDVAKPGARLYYAVYTQDWADEFVPKLNGFDIFRAGTPPIHPREDLAIAFVLPPELLELKMRAIMEHESQVGALFEAFGEEFFRRAMREESFRLAEVKA